MKTKSTIRPLTLALCALCLLGTPAFAATIAPGQDEFVPLPGLGPLELDPFGIPLPPPLFPGPIPLMPDPLFPGLFIDRVTPIDSSPGPKPIDIEIVALSLVSIFPVDIGGDLYEYTLHSGSHFGLPPSIPAGPSDIFIDPGGHFLVDSFFDVFFEITLTPLGLGPPIPPTPAIPQTLHLYGEGTIDPLSLSPTLDWDFMFLDFGSPLGDPIFGFQDYGFVAPEPEPPIPEPASIALLTLGLGGLAARHRSRNKS